MMTVADIHNVTFERSMRGYRAEDVDQFLARVAQEFEALTEEKAQAINEKEQAIAAAAKEKEQMEKKLYILAEKIDQYRQDEENLKTALLNAQRLGETVVHEARQKAETLVYDAKNKANQAQEQARNAVQTEEKRLAHMQAEVAKFKGTILNLYRQHIEALGALPEAEEKKASPIVFALDDKAAPIRPEKEKAAAVASTPKMPEPEKAQMEEAEQLAVEDLADDMLLEVEVPEALETEDLDSFENYQGIRFDE